MQAVGDHGSRADLATNPDLHQGDGFVAHKPHHCGHGCETDTCKQLQDELHLRSSVRGASVTPQPYKRPLRKIM
jgi:hypothetical protein